MITSCFRAQSMWLALATALCCLGAWACTPPANSEAAPAIADPAATASVVRVVDGDTLEVALPAGRERVRLIGIDTPESVNPDSEVECYGVAASEHLADLLPKGTEVELVRDVELRDRYDRLLAYVFRRSDGLFVNLAMASEGYANTLSIAPNLTFADDMTAAVAQARQAGLGLWQACPEPDALFG
ncbi:MAG: thermonuclease family protein [Acidimicrobiales bacterium]